MRLFICTDKQNEALLETLTDVLDGYRMTVDIDRMIGSRDSRPALQAAIQDCEAFVFALTPQTLQNPRCLWEFKQARDNDRPIVFAVLQDVEPFPPAFEAYIVVDMQAPEGGERLLDALYAVGATPPSVLVQLFRNRVTLAITVLLGFLVAWLLAGPYSPYQANVTGTIRDVVAVADRADPQRPIATIDPNDPAREPIRQMTLSATANSLFRTGQQLARGGNYEAAIDTYNRVLEIAPGSVGAHIARGNAFLAIGATDTAWGDYTRAIELAPNLPLPYMSRAAFYVDVGQADGALADVNKVLEMEPDDPQAHNLRGEAYFLRGDYDAALAAFNRALALLPDYAEAYSNRGEVYRYMGDAKSAREDFDTALTLNPILGEVYTRRGALLQSQNNTPAALRDFTRAIELNANDANARYGRALLHAGAGDYALAATDFTRAIAQQPNDPNLYLLRGSAYRCNADPTLAVADFTSAAELDLDATVAYLRRGAAYACADAPPPEIVPSRVGETDPAIAGAYIYITERLAARAATREQGGDFQGAENDYGLALIMTPSYTEAADLYQRRGAMFERRGDISRALADYQTASEILPEQAALHIDVGRLLAQTGETEDALRRFSLALEIDPISIPAYLARGDLYLAQGQPALALDDYTKATFIDKDNTDALTRRVRLLLDDGACQVAAVSMDVLRDTAPDDPRVIDLEATFTTQCVEDEANGAT